MDKFDKEVVVTGIVLDGNTTITFTEIRQRYNIREELLLEMIEHGLVEPLKPKQDEIHLTELPRIESALHLYNDLGVNIAGAVLALDLMQQLNEVQVELVILQKQLNRN
ncbi:MAG: chaperone modulator CbpM [Pseudomonadota bacterium]